VSGRGEFERNRLPSQGTLREFGVENFRWNTPLHPDGVRFKRETEEVHTMDLRKQRLGVQIEPSTENNV